MNDRFGFAALTILWALFFCSCAKKSATIVKHNVNECEARMGDVALPLGAKLIAKQTWPNTLTYSIKQRSCRELIEFYVHEMERLGWALIGWNENTQTTAVFDKPHQLCVISIRQHGKKGRLVRIDTIPKPAY